MGEVGHLEYSYGTVPEYGPGVQQYVFPFGYCLGGCVHAHPSVRDGVGRAYLCVCVVVKCVGGYYLCREVQLYAFLPGLGHSVEGCLELVVLDEGGSDGAALGLHEGVDHAATDNHVVGQVKQVLYDSEFGGDFGSAEDDGQGTLGIAQDLVNRLDLTLHHVAEHLGSRTSCRWGSIWR